MSCGIALYWLKKRYLVRQLFVDDTEEQRQPRRRRRRRYRQLSGMFLNAIFIVCALCVKHGSKRPCKYSSLFIRN